MIRRLPAILMVLLCLPATAVMAQSTSSFPEMPVDARTTRVQNQAEEVYARGDYERAFFIFRHELTPIGDKYGQYMVGFMYLAGQGVERDAVAASAWYRLASERGTKEFVQVRDDLMSLLDEYQRGKSDQLFLDLRRQFGDIALVTRAVREDYARLRERTGSRIGAGASPVTVIDMDATSSGADYYERVERRLKARLAYLARHTGIDVIDLNNLTASEMDEVERHVADHLSRIR